MNIMNTTQRNEIEYRNIEYNIKTWHRPRKKFTWSTRI